MSTEKNVSMMLPSESASRRNFLLSNAMSAGSVALAWLLKQDGLVAEPIKPDIGPQNFSLAVQSPHRPPRAQAMISLFMQGGPSQMDLFDPKPELNKHDGQQYSDDVHYDNLAEASSTLMGSRWRFRKRGQCGTEISDLLPHIGTIVDDITLIRSMHCPDSGHNTSVRAINTGRVQLGRPSLGSWLLYGLGSESQELPAFVVLPDPRALPLDGTDNWSSGWLPSIYRGTLARSRDPRILNLDPPRHLKGPAQRRYLSYLESLNRAHLKRHPGEQELDARIRNYELAARMQSAAREAFDISTETKETLRLYGVGEKYTNEFGTRCLIARRLVERGVRFVQLHVIGNAWDHHQMIGRLLPGSCIQRDKPSAGLVKDLKRRGLLNSTLVHWGGEMGRLPVIQNNTSPKDRGRDHNQHAFSMWLAGGGIKAGHVHGQTDEFGHHGIKDRVSHNDYQATLLHLFGLDHKRLAFKFNAQERSLIDKQPCRIVHEILKNSPGKRNLRG